MTVLAKYQRLEAEAIWRPDPAEQRRDVIVSIGDATLTISAPNGTAVSHWSLPAVERQNPGQRPAIFTPGPDTPETLEIAEDEMIDAIQAVLKAIRRQPGQTRRFRTFLMGLPVLALLVAAGLWLPGAITRYTASLVPEGARAEIGTRLRDEVRRLTGAPCADPAGLRALEKLQTRLFPSGGIRLIVLPSALSETAHIPDGTILIGHRLVEDHESPDVLAGYLLAEDIRRRGSDPLKRILADAGLGSAFRLLTTGRLDDEGLRRHAERLVASRPPPVKTNRLIAAFDAAGVPGSAYAYAVDFSGESTMSLINASQNAPPLAPLLGDGDWIALQGICEG